MRLAGWSMGLLLMLAVRSAGAQAVGDSVRLETETGIVEGTLLDKLPDGYLIRIGEKTEVVPYSKVKSIAAAVPKPVQETSPATEPEAPQPPQPPTPAATDQQPPPPPTTEPAPPPPSPAAARKAGPRSPGLVAGGVTSLIFGSLGVTVGAVLLPIGAVVAADNQCHDPSNTMTFDCEYGNASDMVTAGAISLGVGAALLVGGIVMIIAGSSPAKQQQGRLAPPTGRALWTF